MENILALFIFLCMVGGAFISWIMWFLKRDLRQYKDELKAQMPYRSPSPFPTPSGAPDMAQSYLDQWNASQDVPTGHYAPGIPDWQALDMDMEDEENGE